MITGPKLAGMPTVSTPRDWFAGRAFAARSRPLGGFGPAPWSSAAGRECLLTAAGVPLAVPMLVVLTTPILMAPLLVLLLFGLGLLTTAQRSRFRVLGGLEIPGRRRAADGSRRGPLDWLRSESTWRQASYHLVLGPLLACAGVGVLLLWGAGGALATVFGWAWLTPLGTHVRRDGWTFLDSGLSLLGLLLLTAAPWLAAQVNEIDRRVAAALLGPNRARELERRVEDLAESRAGVVDAADAERRRIERDLHDGAQQRLVVAGDEPGLARETLTDVPPEASGSSPRRTSEAKAALSELRELVRGLHPAVLEDRGLDAALSGIAARAPLPVRLHVRPAAAGRADRRGGRVLRGLRGAGQHRQARRAVPGGHLRPPRR